MSTWAYWDFDNILLNDSAFVLTQGAVQLCGVLLFKDFSLEYRGIVLPRVLTLVTKEPISP